MTRRNPARKIRRRKYRFQVGNTVRRIRSNPDGSLVNQIGGVIGGQLAFSVVNGLIATKIVAGSTSVQSAGNRALISMGVSAGLGVGGYMLLKKSFPNLAVGVAAAAAVTIVTEGLLAAGISLLGSTAAATAAAAAGTGTGAGAGTGAAGTGTGAGAGTGAAGTGATSTAAYLGAPPAMRRRMRSRGMKAYLQPGMPVQSLIGAVTPTRKTFGSAGSLNGFYTGTPAFSTDAWSR
jgi:hypothetical protein